MQVTFHFDDIDHMYEVLSNPFVGDTALEAIEQELEKFPDKEHIQVYTYEDN